MTSRSSRSTRCCGAYLLFMYQRCAQLLRARRGDHHAVRGFSDAHKAFDKFVLPFKAAENRRFFAFELRKAA